MQAYHLTPRLQEKHDVDGNKIKNLTVNRKILIFFSRNFGQVGFSLRRQKASIRGFT